MAYEENLKRLSGKAASDLSTKQFYAAKFDTSGTVALATAAKSMDGILQDKPLSGEACVLGTDGISKAAISASTVVSIGDLLEVDTGSTLKVLASGTAVAKAMQALTSTAAVKVIAVEILRGSAAFV